MEMHPLKLTLAAAAMTLAATSANAVTLTYYLDGSDSLNYYSLSNSFSQTVEGVEATFSAGSFSSVSYSGNVITSGTQAPNPRIGQYAGGAGVVNGPGDWQHTVDSNGWKDFITVSFATDVMITGVTFGYYNSWNDDFRWLADSSGDGSIGVGDFISDELTVTGSYAGFGGVIGRTFAFGAFDRNDSWKLRSVSFETLGVVPLPGGVVMLITGLFGFAAARKVKRRATA